MPPEYFYSDGTAQTMYLKFVTALVTHVNSLSGMRAPHGPHARQWLVAHADCPQLQGWPTTRIQPFLHGR
jgi:hypothetical protein